MVATRPGDALVDGFEQAIVGDEIRYDVDAAEHAERLVMTAGQVSYEIRWPHSGHLSLISDLPRDQHLSGYGYGHVMTCHSCSSPSSSPNQNWRPNHGSSVASVLTATAQSGSGAVLQFVVNL